MQKLQGTRIKNDFNSVTQLPNSTQYIITPHSNMHEYKKWSISLMVDKSKWREINPDYLVAAVTFDVIMVSRYASCRIIIEFGDNGRLYP